MKQKSLHQKTPLFNIYDKNLFMNYQSDPIFVLLQFKSFKTNQLTTVKAQLKTIPDKPVLQLLQPNTYSFLKKYSKSSTFVLKCASVETFQQIFEKKHFENATFAALQQSTLECLVLGGFFQEHFLTVHQLLQLFQFKKSKLNILGNLNKTQKVVSFLKQRLVALPLLCKRANNGN